MKTSRSNFFESLNECGCECKPQNVSVEIILYIDIFNDATAIFDCFETYVAINHFYITNKKHSKLNDVFYNDCV